LVLTISCFVDFLFSPKWVSLPPFPSSQKLSGREKAYLGSAAYNEYRSIAERIDEQHLSVHAVPNLIFVPGVMGSLLQSQTKGGIWWVDVRTRHHIDDLRLELGGGEDADSSNQIAPCSTDPTYEPFLAAVLARPDFGHVVFPYDWRKSLRLSTAALKDRVLQLYGTNGNQPVHLVAHSMGGLLVRATLMEHGPELWPNLGRIVFIATPHYGAPAIAGYLKNHLWGFDLIALLGMYLSRETYRSLWGILGMLPAPRGIYPDTRQNDLTAWSSGNAADKYIHPCGNFDFYQVDNWQLKLTAKEAARLQTVLDDAANIHRKMYQAHQTLSQELRDKMLVIAGVGFQTLFRLAYQSQFFGVWEHTAKVTNRIQGDLRRIGAPSVRSAGERRDSLCERNP
jgi:pimeloyl-ACP methyl ester carboxylesterase